MSFDLQSAYHALTYLAYHLTKAVTAFIQRDSFLYWPFALSALLIAIAVAYAAHRARPAGSFASRLRASLSRELWWNASARADYRLYFANALLLPVVFGMVLFSEKQVVRWLDAITGGATDVAAAADASIASRVAFTIVFFLAYDFGRFVAHTLLHDVPLLWEFHKVHHSAETLNPMTTFRAHPVDLAVMAWVPVLMTGLATWTFNKLAAPVSLYTFLGLHVLVFAFNLIGILRHSHVWLHYGPSWGKWLISPAHHQLHHSREPEHAGGVNRGFELAVWDRLYGTLCVPGRKTEFRMGLGDGTDGQWHNVRRMYVLPFTLAEQRIGNTWRRLTGRAPAAPAETFSADAPKQPRG
ncbi:MAG TPA: sterol desaturase family protein [Burkholderiales bacterium]|nr:sterol desaturase family protein [Burkholderiales bacterium]